MKYRLLLLLTVSIISVIKLNGNDKPNIIFILSDDHRYDFMGFTGKVPWLKTPSMDKLAEQGIHFINAFVTTSLCSPSRASILTGLYSHSHAIVDNQAPMPEGLIFFPQYLQETGYETAFFGKWHMGDQGDSPQPGFDHWESFEGQGEYYNPTLNINGQHYTYTDSTYITDLLTEHAIEWMHKRTGDKPFFIYLSHKAVHAMFMPAKRHAFMYNDEPIIYPPSWNTSVGNPKGKNPESIPFQSDDYYDPDRIPDWVRNQRESWHGVDYMYHGQMEFEEFFRRYCETLLGVDESIGSILTFLEENNLINNSVVIYMGDNGFSFGEHGLIDKRHFYEESAKVPLLVWGPEYFKGNRQVTEMVQNIDIAPTILSMAGIEVPGYMPGLSFTPLLQGEAVTWRNKIFYEYYWEYDFPQTPTMHGVRTDRYKYIRYHGIWDTDEFYDLQEDPYEMHNLIASPEHQDIIKQLANDLYDWLEETDGMQIPLKRTVRYRYGDHRNVNTY